jgi:putative AlgH/UPF0301 family transcriptional regulator
MYKHKFIIAKPSLKDPIFGGRVVLIATYTPEKGAEGFIVNGPVVGKVGYGAMSKVDVPENEEEIIARVNSGEMDHVSLYRGGPCGTEGMYMIHAYKEYLNVTTDIELHQNCPGLDFKKENTFDKTEMTDIIMPGLYFGYPEVLAKIVEDGKVKENKFKFLCGSAVWSPGQLEDEVSKGFWEIRNASAATIFDEAAISKLFSYLPWPQPSVN